MENPHYYLKISLPLFISMFCVHMLMGQSLRQYTVRDGLPTSTVSTIFQDATGLMWLGTNDGISTFDGRTIRKLQTGDTPEPFTGSTVVNIFENDENQQWILSDKGLYRFDCNTLAIDTFPGFNSETLITYGPSDEIYAVREDNFISWYHPEEGVFKKVPVRNLAFDSVMEIFIDQEHNLWIFTDDGNHRSFSIRYEDGELLLTPLSNFRHPEPLLWCFYENGSVYFVDATLTFFAYNLTSRTKHYIQDVRQEVLKYGDISSIIHHRSDFFIGFASGGLLRIKSVPDHPNKYQLEEVPVKVGVLSLATDKFQDIVWIGTSDDGLYMYFNEPTSLDAVLSASLPQPFQSPITSLYMDNRQSLWIGTGGDGVIAIHDYDPASDAESRTEQFTTYNSLLGSNKTHALASSWRGLVWIGTENGLNYYSHNENRIKNIQIVADGKPLKFVRSVCEVNDTTLWVATTGEGLVKIRLGGAEDNPIVTSAHRFMVADGSPEKNNFTVAYREDDNTVWFGSLTEGAWKVDSRAEKIENVRPGKTGNSPQNTVYSIYKNLAGYWFGTADGLVNQSNEGQKVFNESNGLLCKVINGIIEDNTGNLWLSTDRGVMRFNIERQSPHLYKQSGDKSVTDFIPGAYYKDPASHMLLFGGSNGFVTVNENEYTHADFLPEIRFTGLSIFGKEYNINELLKVKRNKSTLRLAPSQNVFGISFVAHDYIDGSDYTYFYRLDEQSEDWIDNGSSNTAFFTYLSPGTYTLSTRYRNNATGKESQIFPLKIRITLPWYQSWWAYIGYLLLLALIIYIGRLVIQWQNRRAEEVITARLNRQFLNETNKQKLDFFASMANELYASLALILNPARRIMSLPGIDGEVRTYTHVIEQNAHYLECFVRDMTELKLLETDERKPQVQTLPVSELADFIAESYLDKAAAKEAGYNIRIDSGIYWNTDSYCLRSVLNTLLAYTFIHLKTGGNVSVTLSVEDDYLRISISGNPMEGDQEQVVDELTRHTVVEAIEHQSGEGLPVHNQLTLGICHNMVRLIGGKVEATVAEEDGISFIVDLPQLPVEEEEATTVEDERPLITYTQVAIPDIEEHPKDPSRLTILVLSVHHSLHWLIASQLSSRYNIEFLTEGSSLPDVVRENRIGLILSEINLPDADGIELLLQMKADPANAIIPFVLLASANTSEEKQRAADSGAELYITKPFDMDFIEKEIDGILQYKELQNYYTSALSRTFELGDEHFAGSDEKSFYDRMLTIIDRNLNNPGLSVELICTEFGCTSQEFYSRLKEITRKTPNEIIREYRLNTVELLLVSTTLPVEEIIDKAGFTNRGNFFKLFSQKYGMTPRNYRTQNQRKIREALENK